MFWWIQRWPKKKPAASLIRLSPTQQSNHLNPKPLNRRSPTSPKPPTPKPAKTYIKAKIQNLLKLKPNIQKLHT